METKEKIVLDGEFEDVFERDGHYYLKSKKDRICVLPYTISNDGLLDNIGAVEISNKEQNKKIIWPDWLKSLISN